MFIVLLTLLRFTSTQAACPNACTKNGVCTGNSTCICENGFTGADCSLRFCAFGKAWADYPSVCTSSSMSFTVAILTAPLLCATFPEVSSQARSIPLNCSSALLARRTCALLFFSATANSMRACNRVYGKHCSLTFYIPPPSFKSISLSLSRISFYSTNTQTSLFLTQ